MADVMLGMSVYAVSPLDKGEIDLGKKQSECRYKEEICWGNSKSSKGYTVYPYTCCDEKQHECVADHNGRPDCKAPVCVAFAFQPRMILAAKLLSGLARDKSFKQLNFVQSVSHILDTIGITSNYVKIKKSTLNKKDKQEPGHVAMSTGLRAIASKAPGGSVIRHSEQLALNRFEETIEGNDDGQRILIVVSTYSPCGKCGRMEQIERMCNGGPYDFVPRSKAKTKKRFKKCIYLYGELWTGTKMSPKTPKGWEAVLKAAGYDVVKQCDLPDMNLAEIEYVDVLYDYDDGMSDIGYLDDESFVVSSVEIGVVVFIGICCFCMLIGFFTGYKCSKFTKIGSDAEVVDDNEDI